MDPLSQILMQRAQMGPIEAQPQDPSQPQALPQAQGVLAVPPNPATKVPQEAKRFSNAQAIMDAYRQGWAPNPVLLRATLGHK